MYAGPPNVREISQPLEKEILERRYTEALRLADLNGSREALDRFDKAMDESHAAIAVSMDYLAGFITREDALYSTYALMTSGDVRKTASADNDRKRRGVEGFFFGSYADRIRYAALSLDGKGLSSYGDFTLVLKGIAVKNRATLLEANSYTFYEQHKDMIPDDFPKGCRSVWSERNKLAVAKLRGRFTSSTTDTEFPGILLSCSGDRDSDDFIEVHIYGPFDRAAVESVVCGASRTSSKAERAQLAVIQETLKKNGIAWVE